MTQAAPMKYQYLVRAHRTIRSCKTAAQIECAIRYKDIVLRTLFPPDSPQYEHWDSYLMTILNTQALFICGLIKEVPDAN